MRGGHFHTPLVGGGDGYSLSGGQLGKMHWDPVVLYSGILLNCWDISARMCCHDAEQSKYPSVGDGVELNVVDITRL